MKFGFLKSKKFKKVCVLQRRACTLIQNFKRNYLENYNDLEHAVKTKNAPFFMIFPNISFFHMVVNYWTGPLSDKKDLFKVRSSVKKLNEQLTRLILKQQQSS